MLSVQATAVHLRSTLELLPRCYSSATYVNIGGRGKKAKKVGTAVERVKAKKRERKRKRKNSEGWPGLGCPLVHGGDLSLKIHYEVACVLW